MSGLAQLDEDPAYGAEYAMELINVRPQIDNRRRKRGR